MAYSFHRYTPTQESSTPTREFRSTLTREVRTPVQGFRSPIRDVSTPNSEHNRSAYEESFEQEICKCEPAFIAMQVMSIDSVILLLRAMHALENAMTYSCICMKFFTSLPLLSEVCQLSCDHMVISLD